MSKKHTIETIREKFVEINDKEYMVKYLEMATIRPSQKEENHGDIISIPDYDIEVEIVSAFDEGVLLVKPLTKELKEQFEKLI